MNKAQRRIIAALRWRVTEARQAAVARYRQRLAAAKPLPQVVKYVELDGEPFEYCERHGVAILRCRRCYVGFVLSIDEAAMKKRAIAHAQNCYPG